MRYCASAERLAYNVVENGVAFVSEPFQAFALDYCSCCALPESDCSWDDQLVSLCGGLKLMIGKGIFLACQGADGLVLQI